MDKKTIGIIMLTIGGLAFLPKLLRSNSRPSRPKYFSSAPQAPGPPKTNKVEQWESWINNVINIYGRTRDLWQPGGPFHKGSYDDTDPAVVDDLLPDRSNYV